MIEAGDMAAVAAQLGREPRGVRAVASRCPCGRPAVIETAPRLADGTPFPTLFYLTCPKAASAIGTLEGSGVMREMQARLAEDPSLREKYAAAHEDYLRRRDEAARDEGIEPLPAGTQSAGGMPDRVKCLHALIAHELAVPGANPFGREALEALPEWWRSGPCVQVEPSGPAEPEPGEPERGGGAVTRVAAVDCGTNAVRLLIADIVSDEDGGSLTDVERRMEIVRLGEGVDETGRLSPAALERTFTAMRGYAELIERHGGGAGLDPIKTRVVATSATRDAANRADFVSGVVDIFGVVPEVISGDEEAELSFGGATRELAALRPARPYLVVDIGGGSTEFVLGSSSAGAAFSIDIGCVRMTERHLADDPPSPQQISHAVADIDTALAAVRERVPVDEARTLVGLAGSVTTVAGIALDLPEYDSSRIHLSRITATQVHEVTRRLLHATRAERARFGVMHPGRVDVIGAGALILDRIMREYGFGAVVVSEHDILDGAAWSLV